MSSPGPGPAPALSDSDTRRTVALLALASFASSVAMRLCDPLLPALAAEFAVGLPAAAATITGFALAYGVLQLAIGPLADRLGKYRVINLAVALAALATLAGALAPGMDTLVWTRVLAGGVAGAIIPVALAWIGDEVAYAQRQPVLARLMSGVLMGAVLGQLLSGLLADTLGWRWAFGVVAGLFAAVAWWMHRSPVARQPARRGAAGPARGLRGWWRGYLGLARPPWARLVLAVALTEGLLWYGAVAFVPTALHQRFGVPLWQAAGVAALVGVGGLAYTLLASPLVRRLGEARLALLGGLLVTLGLLAIGLAPWLPVVAAGALLLGMGFYAFHNTLQVHGTQLSTDSRGMAMALFALCLFLGQSIGVALAAQLTAWVGFGSAFGVAALAFLLLTLGFVVALGRRGGAVPG